MQNQNTIRNMTNKLFKNKNIMSYLLLLPALFMIAVFMFYPIFNTFYLSTMNYVLTKRQEWGFIGLGHFKKILFDDPLFWKSLYNSFVWSVLNVFFQFLFGLLLALLLNQKFKARGVYRAVIFSPWAVGGILVALMWGFMFNGNYGVINDILMKAGVIDERISWFSNGTSGMLAMIIANVWRGIPFFAISMLASLQTIPTELYEACDVDGANSMGKFIYVTLPLIKDAIVLTTLLRLIWSFNIVDIIYGMTGGGPNNSTLTLPLYILKQAQEALDYGYGSALAVAMTVILTVLAILYMQASKFGRDEN